MFEISWLSQHLTIAQQCLFFSQILYVMSITSLKLSIGFFLMNITIRKRYILISRILIVLSAMCGIAYLLVLIFSCRPVSFNWLRTISVKGRCMAEHTLEELSFWRSAFTTATDWAFAILPAFLVWDLHMTRKRKIMSIFLMSLGAV